MNPESLIETLKEIGLMEAEDGERFLKDAESTDIFILLEAAGFGSKEEVLRTVADCRGFEYLNLRGTQFPPELLRDMPLHVMRIFRCFPTHVSNDVSKVCFVDPLDDLAVIDLQKVLGTRVEVVVADPDLVHEILAGLLADSPDLPALTDDSRTALVAASLGSMRDEVKTASSSYHLGGLRMVALALFVVSAVATAALYSGQGESAQSVQTLLEEFDAFTRSHQIARLALEEEIRGVEREFGKLIRLLERNEVDVIKLGQLEAETHRLEGLMEGLNQIKMASEPSLEADEKENGAIN